MYKVSTDDYKKDKKFYEFQDAMDYLIEQECNGNPSIIFDSDYQCIYKGELFKARYC